jgi:hypothetical protein
MDSTDMDSSNNGRPQPEHVREVVRSAEQELRELLSRRAEVMKRIGTIKQTLTGLAGIFGKSVLSPELSALVEGRSGSERQRGFTRACRIVLMESPGPLSSRQVCDELHKRFPEVLGHHSSPLASVTTVLGRLEDYAEVGAALDSSGRRTWFWIADRASNQLSPSQEPEISNSRPQ